ncbi:hypothetical protein HLRTI_000392 [Halorhabdus tiamatea SARL4B]|uniref:Uncharacterized protein n=1 Tax=Halorhabdus tiamatea SARL4B TaxID=1033806 RepID=U2E608_9EURY|nr:hypothetical protein [Halorhabdus tiamatea]ERJ07351.1 hypothetical protein HLRTI_000392 [Halorhabdus tiamatea SARL4B]
METQATDDGDVLFDDLPFDEGEEVLVDWSEGKGPQDVLRGTVENLTVSGEVVIVHVVDHTQEDWPNGRTYDCAPEWIFTSAFDSSD